MNIFPPVNKRTAMAAAIAVTLGTVAPLQTASAKVYVFETYGVFTMVGITNASLTNSSLPYSADPTWGYGLRTQVSGTFTYDSSTGEGVMEINPFDFFAGGQATAHDVVTQAIGDGMGGPGSLVAGHMLFDWNSTTNINVGIIFDAQGMLDALATISVGDVLSGVGAIPASNTTSNTPSSAPAIGASPIATTTWNTDFDAEFTGNVHTSPTCVAANSCLSSNDTVGGDPMDNGPFPGNSANFDFTYITLLDDGSGPTFTAPANIATTATAVRGDNIPVDLGTVTDESSGFVDYSIDGKNVTDPTKAWINDDDGTNTINLPVTGTVNTLTVNWCVSTVDDNCGGGGIQAFKNQTVTITINDTTAPTFDTVPDDFTVSVTSTPATVTFEGPTSGRGEATASDAVDATPTVAWSLDGLNWTTNSAGDESSSGFVPGVNIVYWRAIDDTFDPTTAPNNKTIHEQRITVNLPSGIIGQPCTVDTELLNASIGDRAVTGVFKMRDSFGSFMGTTDEQVTGTIDTAKICADETCTDSGAALATTQTFFGNLWDTETIRLFGPGTYNFDTCPGPISGNVAGGQGIAADGSTKCDLDNNLTMTVGPNQLGGHMLFNWSVNRKIDVVVVWDYSCGAAELVQTDPDGDGVIGSQMVDGPFKGANAAFDLSTANGERPITTGGYTVSIPTVNNPVPGSSPLAISPGTVGNALGGTSFTAAQLSGWGAEDDSRVVESCVGGCFDFSISGRSTGETIQVVLPLSQAIPWYSLYRKYDVASDSWKEFVTNDTDNVMTAPMTNGVCPEPGAGDYSAYSNGILAGMLRPNDQCVQLTITDNGPNDDDPTDGTIADPSGPALTSGPTTPTTQTTDGGAGGGGCALNTNASANQRLDLWLLAGLMAFFGLRRKTQQK